MEETIKNATQQILPWLLAHGIKVVLMITGAYILNKLAKKFVLKTIVHSLILDKHQSEQSQKKRKDTLYRIFSWVISITITLIAALMSLQEIGVPIGPILASAGIVGLAVGFGGQYLIRDIITGFFIILENQYRIGDVVSLDDTGGLVEDISLRMTTLRDMDGTVHHVPHGDVKRVANLSKYFSRINLNIGISYNAKLEHVINVVNRVGNELAQDKQFAESIISPPQFLRVDDFADSAVIIKILGDTQPLKQWDVAGELRKRLKIEFDKEGIEIPFPQRVIYQAK